MGGAEMSNVFTRIQLALYGNSIHKPG